MKLAVSTYSLWRWRKENSKSLDDAVRWIADQQPKIPGVEFVGLDDLRLAPEFLTSGAAANRAGQLRQLCDHLSLQIAGYCTHAVLLLPAAQQRDAVELLKRHVDVAAALGVSTMRHDVTTGPVGPKKMSFPAVIKSVVPAIRAVADYAQTKGIKTSFENHGFYLQTASRVARLLDGVDHPNFGLTLDLGNFLCLNQDPVAAARLLAPRAQMVHIKDFHLRPKSTMPTEPGCGWFATPTKIALRGAILGAGVIDIPVQLKILRRAKYAGWLSLEFEGIEPPELGITLGLAWLRNQLGN